MKFFLFFTLLFLLIIPGCTLLESNGSGDIIPDVTPAVLKGLTVANFTSDFYNMRVYEKTNIKLLFDNKGDFDARNVKSVLYGYGLMNVLNEDSERDQILKNQQEINVWGLEVPLKLSQTESTTYYLNARFYYTYNFSGSQQIGFVEPDYDGGDLPLTYLTSDSPLKVSFEYRNPIRTFPPGTTDDKTIFTLTTIIENQGEGNVDYFGCSILGIPPCRKEGYMNELRMTTPADWHEVMNMNGWERTCVGTDYVELSFLSTGKLDGTCVNGFCTSTVPANPYIGRSCTQNVECTYFGEAMIYVDDKTTTSDDTTTQKSLNNGPGVNTVLLNPDGSFVEARFFRMWEEDPNIATTCPTNSNVLGTYLNSLTNGQIIIITMRDDMYACLPYGNALTAIQALGSTMIDKMSTRRTPWGMISVVGEGVKAESMEKSETGRSATGTYDICRNQRTYTLNYDTLETAYDYYLYVNDNTPCYEGIACMNACPTSAAYTTCTGLCTTGDESCINECLNTCIINCANVVGCNNCRSRINDERCNLIGEALNHLKLVRGEESRIVLQFAKSVVSDPVIDDFVINGDFGYESDTSDFTNAIRLNIQGD